MRLVILPIALLGASSAARANPLAPIDPAAIPASCRDLARVPVTATDPTPNLAAHLSVANCAAEVRMEALTALAHDDASLRALKAAVAPTLVMLDDIAAHGGVPWRIIARFSRGDLYDAMIVRMRNATHGDATLEPELKPWRDLARDAFAEVVQLARANPSLVATNPVLASAVHASERELGSTAAP